LNILVQLLAEPNVLLLDEPTNDLDTDMLTALEDVLDSWPGTLVVVSHDRYLVERVTDQQYALIDGRLRHLPRGIDQYLELAPIQARRFDTTAATTAVKPDTPSTEGALVIGSKHHRAAQKQQSQLERRLAGLQEKRDSLEADIAAIDPSAWEELSKRGRELGELNAEIESVEAQWLDVATKLEQAT